VTPRRPIAAALAGCLLAMTPARVAADTPPAPPPTGEDALARARLCLDAVDVPCASAELERALAGDLDPAERQLALRLLAELRLAAGARDEARALCVELLALAPGFSPAAWPESWRAVLDEARRLAPDRLPPTLSAALPGSATPGDGVEIEAEAKDPSGVARVELVVAPGDLRFRLQTADGERWRVTVPGELVQTPGLQLRVEAWDRAGNGPAAFPADGAHTVVVAPAPEAAATPITETWWFWTGVAVVTAGLAVGLAVWLGGNGDDDADGLRTGDLRVTPTFPTSP
jgi:hypothetical protein